jgi:hypothetical protein
VYLTDFGLTKRTSELSGGLTGTGHFLGTVDYVSPEQIQGQPVGSGTDIYALGCVLYECLTGQLPFRREDDAALLWAHLVEAPPPVTAVRPEIPGAVNSVVGRAMAKDPADRYESCQELVAALELALGMPAPVSSTGASWSRDSRALTGRPDATSDGALSEPGTVTGDVPGGSQHPSFPSGPPLRFPAQRDASYEAAQYEAAQYEAAQYEAGPPADREPDYEEYPEFDQDDDGSDWEQGEPVAPPEPLWRRRRWRLVALVAAAAVLVAVGAVVLRSTLLSEDYRTYTSNQTLVPFRLDHPADWGSAVGSASDVVLGPDPTTADELFFLKGTPDAWASTTDIVRSGAPEDVWLYVYTSAATFDTSGGQALEESIAPLLPATTEFESVHHEVSVAGGPGDEMEAVAYDPQQPQTRLRVLMDVVQPPGAGGAVLLAFFAPPTTFEDHRPTFERIRDSLQIGR